MQRIKKLEEWCKYSILLVVSFFSLSLIWAFWFLHRSIFSPLAVLSDKTREIGKGNLDVALPAFSDDEIGDFARSFNDMAHKLKAMTVSRDTLAAEVTARQKVEKRLKKNEASLKALSAKVMSAMEEERKRIGREIHDSVVQDMIALKLQQENAIRFLRDKHPDIELDWLEKNLSYIQKSIVLLREIIMGLRPAILDDLGLIPALQWYCREFAKTYSQYRFGVDIREIPVDVPENIGTAIFRIIQESLQNVIKHGDATRINVRVFFQDQSVEAWVTDNGKGFETQGPDAKILGMGISGMRERTEGEGGLFFVHSAPGEGVTIRVVFPLKD
ncbi:HAMP domain-containing sensor histidine kinase [Desulfoplanes sp.]